MVKKYIWNFFTFNSFTSVSKSINYAYFEILINDFENLRVKYKLNSFD